MSLERNAKDKTAHGFLDGTVGTRLGTTMAVLALLSTPATALNLGGVGVGVDVSLGHGGVGVGVDVGLGGGGVGVDVGLGGGGSGGGGSGGGSGGGGSGGGGSGGGGSGGGPGDGGAEDDGDQDRSASTRSAAGASGRMPCAGGGNATAFNGFVVRDREGAAIGWVNDAKIGPDQKILSVKMQSNGKACYSLTGGTFRLTGEEVWVNVDGAKFR
jgi:hypothetical protein